MREIKMKKGIDFFKILCLFTAIGSAIVILAFLGAYFILRKGTPLFIFMAVLTCATALLISIIAIRDKNFPFSINSKDKKTQFAIGISAIIFGISSIYITITKSKLTVLDIIFSSLFILGGIGLILKRPEE